MSHAGKVQHLATLTIANGTQTTESLTSDVYGAYEYISFVSPSFTGTTIRVQTLDQFGGSTWKNTYMNLPAGTPAELIIQTNATTIIRTPPAPALRISTGSNEGAERTIYVYGIRRN